MNNQSILVTYRVPLETAATIKRLAAQRRWTLSATVETIVNFYESQIKAGKVCLKCHANPTLPDSQLCAGCAEEEAEWSDSLKEKWER